MKKIYKYSITSDLALVAGISNSADIELPKGSIIRFCGVQNGWINIWVEIDPNESQMELYEFIIYGTGWDIPSESNYVGTVMLNDGAFVYHVYYRKYNGRL